MAGDDPSEEADDERTIELEALAAIFPELVIQPSDGPDGEKKAQLKIEVEPVKPLQIRTRQTTDVASGLDEGAFTNGGGASEEVHEISSLPPLIVDICLPLGYPTTKAPGLHLSSQESWLSDDRLRELENAAITLWEDMGQDQVLFTYIDHLREIPEDAFGVRGTLEVSPDMKLVLLDYDLKAKKAKFEKETYECGICLEPKKGAVCHRLQSCSHVFCIACLQEFYTTCITEGDVGSVKCLATKCPMDPPSHDNSKEATTLVASSKDRTLGPSELLQMCLSQETVQRYITLKRKKALESDRNTLYCPRQWCQGPARHKLPNTDYLSKANTDSPPPLPKPADRLAICLDCAFAFCLVCKASWHGEFYTCFPRSQFEITVEEKASEDYMLLHTQACPTCDARAQKTHGCNHMICFKCDTHFCYLCGSYLQRGNPYEHFNNQKASCYMRLWELEGGDDGEFGQAFAGGREGGGFGFDSEDEDEDEDDDDEIVIQVEEGEVFEPVPPPAPAAPRPPRRAAGPGIRAGGNRGRDIAGPGLRRFLEMARQDAEDEWDSDDMSGEEDEEFE